MGQVTEAETAVAEVYDHGSEFESADDDETHTTVVVMRAQLREPLAPPLGGRTRSRYTSDWDVGNVGLSFVETGVCEPHWATALQTSCADPDTIPRS